jgi:ubiquitin-like 1-activating enzyme E1 B
VLVLNLFFSKGELGDEAVQGSTAEQPDIPRRPKKTSAPELNGHVPATNGTTDPALADSALGKRRRDDEDGATPAKKARKVDGPGADDEVVVIEDDGAIVLD